MDAKTVEKYLKAGKILAKVQKKARKEAVEGKKLLDIALKITNTECGSIMIVDENKEEMSIKVSRGIKSEKFETSFSSGISPATIETALAGLEPIPRVLELDRRQPEFTQTFWQYIDKRVSNLRISRGRQLLKEHHDLLAEIEKQYGVQPRFLVAFWGLETNFGGGPCDLDFEFYDANSGRFMVTCGDSVSRWNFGMLLDSKKTRVS